MNENHTSKLTREDEQMILLALGFMLGALAERKEERLVHVCKRTLEIANKLGCTYDLAEPKPH